MTTSLFLENWSKKFTGKPRLYRAPGRINLIGEHTDYNQGFVMPAAVTQQFLLGMNTNKSRSVNLYSIDYESFVTIDLDGLKLNTDAWQKYLIACLLELETRGYQAKGVDVALTSTIPVGGGMSSSAALTCGFIYALSDLFDWQIDRLEIAKIGQAAEHQIGTMCGLMDQFASLHGKAGHLIRLDCRDMSYDHFPFNLAEAELVLINSKVVHSLADTEFNTRRTECEQVLAHFQQREDRVKSLRDISLADLEGARKEIGSLLYQRVSFVLEENARVQRMSEELSGGNLRRIGKLLYESHQGLTKKYSVSCEELDLLVDLTEIEPAVFGARMMGGGFGGCTINLIKREGSKKALRNITRAYRETTGITPEVYHIELCDGIGGIS